MIDANLQASFSNWWDARCRRYLDKNFGKVSEEILPQLTSHLFPQTAEPTLPEQALPLAFIHLRLLAGEDLNLIIRRLERLGALFGLRGVKPEIGLIYLILTSLTSTPGKLSSLSRAQSAFFSLLLRRVAALMDRGVSEDDIREEFSKVWELASEEAIGATLTGGRGLWRRLQDPLLGMGELPFGISAWMAENGLLEEWEAARKRYPLAASHPHLEMAAERMTAVDVLLHSENAIDTAALLARQQACQTIQESLAGGIEGLVPWEVEVFRPADPLLLSLIEWSDRLRLLSGGETPTAHPGRDRLPDRVNRALNEGVSSDQDGGLLAVKRLAIGGDTYLAAGIDAEKFSPELAVVALQPPLREAEELISFRVQFGDGTEMRFRFNLQNGRELLEAVRLALQPDIRLDLFLREQGGRWRFAASRYLLPEASVRESWLALVGDYLYQTFQGEEDRVRHTILQGVEAGGL